MTGQLLLGVKKSKNRQQKERKTVRERVGGTYTFAGEVKSLCGKREKKREKGECLHSNHKAD